MTRRVRCTVESFNYSACGLEVGDHFDVDARGLTVPEGKRFCYFAIGSVVPLLAGRLDSPSAEAWLASRPLLACPDPPENLLMRLETLEDDPT